MLLAEWTPRWAELFAEEAACLRAALGGLAVAIEHYGSTSVPGLLAKPRGALWWRGLAYARLKRELAEHYGTERSRYTAGKAGFVERVLKDRQQGGPIS